MAKNREEKKIEQSIRDYLLVKGAITEAMQSGLTIVGKGKDRRAINMNSKGCPDIFCFYKGKFIGIEVKKNQKTVDNWMRIKGLYDQNLPIPKSYDTELGQIRYMYRILNNWGEFILTHQVNTVMDYINNYDKELKNKIKNNEK